MKDIILLGKPGSGKGTIAINLVKTMGYYQLSGSDLLRENSKDKSAKFYKEAKFALDMGVLVDSDIINGMVGEKFKELKRKNVHIVFDGYPRTIAQAKFLLRLYSNPSDVKTLTLEINEKDLTQRIISRIVCKGCGSSFSTLLDEFKPKKEGVCDYCGSELYKRVDDNKETLKVRLDQYEEHTKPVADYLAYHIKCY